MNTDNPCDKSKCEDKDKQTIRLITTWTPTFCLNGFCLKKVIDQAGYWNFHGLWLDGLKNQTIKNCSGATLNWDCPDLGRLYDTHMEDLTTSQKRATYEKKHGTCIDCCLSEDSRCLSGYFIQRYDIGYILNAGNITPGGFYHIRDIHQAIKNTTTKNAFIDCVEVPFNNAGLNLLFLHEIALCFNLKYECIDCDEIYTYTNKHPWGETILRESRMYDGEEVFTNHYNSDGPYIYYPKDVAAAFNVKKFAYHLIATKNKMNLGGDDGDTFFSGYVEYKKQQSQPGSSKSRR